MGERDHDREHDHGQPRAGRRVTVQEAAGILGTTVEAIRHRLRRGTLAGEKVDDRVFVILDGDHADTGQPTDQPGAGRGQPTDGHDRMRDQPRPDDQPAALVDELRDRIAYLERQVEEEREARRRADGLLLRFVERVPEIEPPPTQEPRGARESAADDRPGTNTPAGRPSPQTAAQPRPRSWWRRLIGS